MENKINFDGDRIDNDTMRCYRTLRESFDAASNDEEKFMIALDITTSVLLHGVRICINNQIVRTLELIIKTFPNPDVIGPLFKIINTDLEFVITNKYSSMLLQKVLMSCQISEIADDDIVQIQAKVFNEYMWLHYPDYLENNIGSHVVRSWIQFISGCYVEIKDKLYDLESAIISKPMEEDGAIRFEDLVKRFLLNKHMDQLLTSNYVSSFAQLVLVIKCKINPDKEVFEHLMLILCNVKASKKKNKSDDTIQIPESFQDRCKSFFIECLIVCLPEEKLLKYFERKYLKDAKTPFLDMSVEYPQCCAILKAIIKRQSNTSLITNIIQEIHKILLKLDKQESMGNIFMSLLTVFLSKIELFKLPAEADLLRSFKHSITEIVQFMSKNEGGKNCLLHLLKAGLRSAELSLEDNTDEVEADEVQQNQALCSMPSSVFVQHLLAVFDPLPRSINRLFTGLQRDDLVILYSDAKASRAIEAYLESKNVLVGSKVSLMSILESKDLLHMACNVYGSRVLDGIHRTGEPILLDLVKSNLQDHKARLKTNKFGRFVEAKFLGYVPRPDNKKGELNRNFKSAKQNNFNSNKRHNFDPNTNSEVTISNKRQNYNSHEPNYKRIKH